MRKILIILLVGIALTALWLWRGRDLSMLVDRFYVIETSQHPIKTISYGKEKPQCTEANEDCWQKNRRDHFTLLH